MDTPTAQVVPVTANEFRVGDVFGRSFELFARRFVPFLGLTIIAFLPTYFLTYLMASSEPTGAYGVAAFIIGIATVVCGTLASAAVTYGVVQELRGRSFTLPDSLAVALRRFIPMIGVGLCFGLLAGLASLLLIIPGLIVMCIYYVAAPACVVERTGVFASFSRSAALTKGHRWQILGIVLLLYGVSTIVNLLIGIVAPGAGTMPMLLMGAWQALTGAFGAVLNGVLYFRLRTAREGLDIDQIAGVFD